METIKYELKYYERCGTLKLRPIASASMYCRRCEGLLARYVLVDGKARTGGGATNRVSSRLNALAIPVVTSGALVARAQ